MWILWKNSIFSFSKFLSNLSFLNLSTLKYLSFWFLSTLLIWSTLLTSNLVSANSDSIFTIEGLNLNQEHISSNWWNNWNNENKEQKILKEKDNKDIFDVKENKDLRKENVEKLYHSIKDQYFQTIDLNFDWKKDFIYKSDINPNNNFTIRFAISEKNWKFTYYDTHASDKDWSYRNNLWTIFFLQKNWKTYSFIAYWFHKDNAVENFNKFLSKNSVVDFTNWQFIWWSRDKFKKLWNTKFSWIWRYFIYNKNTDSDKSLLELKNNYWKYEDCDIYWLNSLISAEWRKSPWAYWRYSFNWPYYDEENLMNNWELFSWIQYQDWLLRKINNDWSLYKKSWIEILNFKYVPICNQTWEETWQIFDENDISAITQSWRQDMNWDWYNDLYFYNFQTWKIEWYIYKKNIKDKYIYFEYDNSYSTWWLSSNDSYSKKWWDVMKSSNPDWTMNIQIYWKDWEEVWNISNIHDFEFKDFDNDWNKELLTFENYIKNWIEYKKMKIYVLNSEWKYEEKMEEKIVDYKVLDINGVWNKELIYTWLDWKSRIAYFKDWQFEVDSNIFWEIELRDLNNDWVQEIVSKKKINWTNYYQFDFFKTDTDWYHKLWWSWVIWLSLSDELWDVNNDWLTDFVINKWWLWKVIFTKTTWWIDLSSVNWLPFIKIWETSLFKTTWFFIWTDWSNNAYFVNFIKDKENPEVISNDIFLFEYKRAVLWTENFTWNTVFEQWYSKLKRFNKSNWYLNFSWSESLSKSWVLYTEFENVNNFNLNYTTNLTPFIKNTNDIFWFKLSNWTYWIYINWKIIITWYSETWKKIISWTKQNKRITFLEWDYLSQDWTYTDNWNHWNFWNYDSTNYFTFVKIKNDSWKSWLYLIFVKFSETFDHTYYWTRNFQDQSFWWQKIFNLKPDNTYNSDEIKNQKNLLFASTQASSNSQWLRSLSPEWYESIISRRNNNTTLLPWFVYHPHMTFEERFKTLQYTYKWQINTWDWSPTEEKKLFKHKQTFFNYLNWNLWE